LPLARETKDKLYAQFARLGVALSSPKRLELLDLLCQSEKSVEMMAEQASLSVANTSRHLQVLRAARLVDSRKDGVYVFYSLADSEVCNFFRSLRSLAENRIAEIESSPTTLTHRKSYSPSIERLCSSVQKREISSFWMFVLKTNTPLAICPMLSQFLFRG
jgi:DNA-binding transcriptional ArsR family regulator